MYHSNDFQNNKKGLCHRNLWPEFSEGDFHNMKTKYILGVLGIVGFYIVHTIIVRSGLSGYGYFLFREFVLQSFMIFLIVYNLKETKNDYYPRLIIACICIIISVIHILKFIHNETGIFN